MYDVEELLSGQREAGEAARHLGAEIAALDASIQREFIEGHMFDLLPPQAPPQAPGTSQALPAPPTTATPYKPYAVEPVVTRLSRLHDTATQVGARVREREEALEQAKAFWKWVDSLEDEATYLTCELELALTKMHTRLLDTKQLPLVHAFLRTLKVCNSLAEHSSLLRILPGPIRPNRALGEIGHFCLENSVIPIGKFEISWVLNPCRLRNKFG